MLPTVLPQLVANDGCTSISAKLGGGDDMDVKPRDPARIGPVLALVREAWELDPQFRLGQLLFAVAHSDDPFAIQDDELEARLRDHVAARRQTLGRGREG